MAIILSMASGGCGTGYVFYGLRFLRKKLNKTTYSFQAIWEPKRYTNLFHIYEVNHKNSIDVLNFCWKNMYANMEIWEKEGNGLLVEISHRHIKGWLYRAAKEIPELKVINIDRDHIAVAKSFYETGKFKTIGNPCGWLEPQWEHNLTILPDLNHTTHMQRVVWYIMEIEERKKKFIKDHPHIPIINFSMNNRTLEGWQPILDLIDKLPTAAFKRYVEGDVKKNSWDKKRWGNLPPITDEQIQEVFDKHEIIYNDKEVNI